MDPMVQTQPDPGMAANMIGRVKHDSRLSLHLGHGPAGEGAKEGGRKTELGNR